MTISELRAQIAAELEGDIRFSGCKVQSAYPAARREFPVTRPIIAVGLDGLEMEPGLGGFLVSGENDQYGAPCVLSMRFDIFTPDSVPGPDPCELLEAVLDRLAVSGNRFGFFAFKGGRPAWDKNAESNLLTATGKLRMAVSHTGGESFTVSRFDVISSEI
ncbi:MAG: hypothetical protein FWH02_05790 [Oscillospiraceae bacterium]|nr:hypothetical protein [Oscillospiraceae bacterium]